MSTPATDPPASGLVRKDAGAGSNHGSWRYLACGLVVTGLLVCAKLAIEATPAGTWIERSTRGFLFGLMSPFRTGGADTTVLDISDIPGGQADARDVATRTTSRARLHDVLAALDRLRVPPAAVGIDVDFAGTPAGWADPEDPAFFDYCLELDRHFPVRLGVWRSLASPTDAWLVLPRYQPLAAALYVRDPDSGALPVKVGMRDDAPPRLLTLGAALAAAVGGPAFDPLALGRPASALERWMFEEVTERETRRPPFQRTVRTLEAPVNYALVRQMDREVVRGIEPRDIAMYADRLEGHIVLLGEVRTAGAGDRFRIPGDPVDRPGVFLHAAQAFTLTAEPIYEFSRAFRLGVDVALPVAIMLGMLALRRRAAGAGEGHDHERVERRAQWATAAVVLLVAVLLLVWYRIFWLDVALVFLFLLLHKPFDAWVQRRLPGFAEAAQ